MSTRIMLMYKLFRKAMRQLHCAHCLQIAYVYAHQDSEARFSSKPTKPDQHHPPQLRFTSDKRQTSIHACLPVQALSVNMHGATSKLL